MSYDSRHIDGDVNVGRNVAIGGDATVQGKTHLKGNVKIDGWLDARNIKGPNKGIFPDAAQLRKAYPLPHDGWWALVGDTLPAPLYLAEGGEWVATGKSAGNPTVDFNNPGPGKGLAGPQDKQSATAEDRLFVYATNNVTNGVAQSKATVLNCPDTLLKQKNGKLSLQKGLWNPDDNKVFVDDNEVPVATSKSDGAMSASDKAKMDSLPAAAKIATTENLDELSQRVTGVSDSSSAYTDPFISLGELNNLQELSNALNTLYDKKYMGRCRATITGMNIEIFQFVQRFDTKIFSQVILGNVAPSEDGTQVVFKTVEHFDILARYCINEVWSAWKSVSKRDIPVATPSADGLMSSADKRKVDNMPQPQDTASATATSRRYVYSVNSPDAKDSVLNAPDTFVKQKDGQLKFQKGLWNPKGQAVYYTAHRVPVATAGADGAMAKEVFDRLGTGGTLREGTPTTLKVPIVYPNWATGGTRTFDLLPATSARAGLMTATDKNTLTTAASAQVASDFSYDDDKQTVSAVFTAAGGGEPHTAVLFTLPTVDTGKSGLMSSGMYRTFTTYAERIAKLASGKVDKVEGKGLSTNDYTDDDKQKVENLNNITPISVGFFEGVHKGADYGGVLRIYGHEKLVELGYVPVIFRRKKCERHYRKYDYSQTPAQKLYSVHNSKKGWICYGSPKSVKIESGVMMFTTENGYEMKDLPMENPRYSQHPLGSLIRTYEDGAGKEFVLWSRRVPLKNNNGEYRNLKFDFGLGFISKDKPYNEAITLSDLVSTLAEFTVIVQHNNRSDSITATYGQ